jgi:hypothetical protein
LQPDHFESQIVELRQRFVDPKNSNFVFKPVYHKRIPADGFAPYLAGIWVNCKLAQPAKAKQADKGTYRTK